MGAASEARWRRKLREDADLALARTEEAPGAGAIRERVNSLPMGSVRLFASTVARHDGERWWVMNRREQGWASGGRWHRSLDEIRQTYACALGLYDRDEHGSFWEVLA